MPSPSMKTRRRAAALPFAASLLLFSAAAPAFADQGAYSVELRQELPRTATSDMGGVPQEGREGCPGIPDGMDGWHFVLPGNSTDFVSLTVTFEPGGQQVLTEFGPPSGKHAYVASESGAELVAVEAEVEGGSLELFNLSHTCPAGSTPTTPAEEPAEEPTEEPAPDESAPSESEGPASSPEPTVAPSDSSPAAPSDGGAEGAENGDLAETGSGAPVGALAAGAAALVGAGGYLVMRRRKATAGQG